ncbi:helix-turn-helix domain-containing protein [Mycolicibacterium lutetiense]|uniref:Uncharacterized protein n=1 Tax=Mycolicibacterium lutetiense TaxID=1641992 RepID=A0ABS5A363_9MYCO|nr:helix-turn-helix domain-containing protein [Mycolicibacterium lutetiense]MBP2456193.1 hypothetical protein [Mycolicibacterium lutetiense]
MDITRTAHIGAYLQQHRLQRELSQSQVADLGGPYRQAQAAIEAGDNTDISRYAREYDRAYRWPVGMTERLHQHIQAGLTEEPQTATYGDRYTEAVNTTGEPPRVATLGFIAEPGPDLGQPVDLEPEQTLLTNGHPLALTTLANSRAGITFLDTTVDNITTADGDTHYLRQIHKELTRSETIPTRKTVTYQVGADQDYNRFGDLITVDPVNSLTGTSGARTLAAGLIAAAQYDAQPGKVESIAYTLLGIAAYGGGMQTITDLGPQGAQGYTSFLDYWNTTFYKASQASPALASPDRTVCALFAGLLAARVRDSTWRIDGQQRPATHIPHTGPALVDVDEWNLSDNIVITYDAQLAPEIPVAITKGFRTGALHYYAANAWTKMASHAVAQHLGSGIGLTTAPDEAILAARDDKTATLTHWIGSTAIYTPTYGLPRRINLPNC